jgi:DNA-binding transcriptional LysR family regulator
VQDLGLGMPEASDMIVAAGSGMGIAVNQPCLVERELATGERVRPFPLEASTGRGYSVCARKIAAPDGPAGLFIGCLRVQAQSGAA